jgi:RNA polymerase sigma-70 factor (ECF subfamily)
MAGVEESREIDGLLERAVGGDAEAWRLLLSQNEDRLRRMIAMRIDQRLERRATASDILQETYLEAATHLADYARDPKMPFYLWLRGIAGNKLLHVHRQHLQIAKRNMRREVYADASPETTAVALADALAADDTSPSGAAVRNELRASLKAALEELQPLDREVLALRHFEHLSNAETAQALGIEPAAASKRYLRALERLRTVLGPSM